MFQAAAAAAAAATADVAILNADVLTVLDTRNCSADTTFLERAWPARTRPFIMIHDVGCTDAKAISLSCCRAITAVTRGQSRTVYFQV